MPRKLLGSQAPEVESISGVACSGFPRGARIPNGGITTIPSTVMSQMNSLVQLRAFDASQPQPYTVTYGQIRRQEPDSDRAEDRTLRVAKSTR